MLRILFVLSVAAFLHFAPASANACGGKGVVSKVFYVTVKSAPMTYVYYSDGMMKILSGHVVNPK